MMALAPGCARENSGEPVMSSGGNTEAVLAYGHGPQPNPSVRYQPDVVVIGGGPDVIRSLSEDGLTWTIDADAAGARDLSPGKIMFATSRAVGRVFDIERRGRDVAVTIGPVGLTEVIRDATIRIDQLLNLRLPAVARSAGQPEHGYARDPTAVRDSPRMSLAMWNPNEGGFRRIRQSESAGGSVTAKAADFEVQPFFESTTRQSDGKQESIQELGVKISRNLSGLKLAATASLYGRNMRIRADLLIADGVLKDSSTFVLEGIEGLDIGFVTGSDQGEVLKFRLEDVMVDTGVNFTFSGVPMAVTLKIKPYMEFAFSSSNSTISAHGRYTFSGLIGFEGGTTHQPTFGVEEPMMQSITGVTIGPAGVVAAIEFRLLLGFGNKDAAVAGGYGKAVVSMGVSRGSALGLPIADCHGIALKVDVGAGFGLEVNRRLLSLLQILERQLGGNRRDMRRQYSEMKKQLGKGKFEADLYGRQVTIVDATSVEPNIPICGGGR
jgi:hypothetical protein